jgi:hypothetical protein
VGYRLCRLFADCINLLPGADKKLHERNDGKKSAEEKPVRKRKYSPIPAPPSKADREKAKGKEEPVTDGSKRQKGSPEGAAKDAAKPAVLDRLAKNGSVFDRLESGKKAALVDAKAELFQIKVDLPKKERQRETSVWYIGFPESGNSPAGCMCKGFVRDIHPARPDLLAGWL